MDSQVKGGKHDSAETINCAGNCDQFFDKVKSIFFNINSWDKLFNNGTDFQVTDQFGKDKFDNINSGDLVKIKIAGPKNKAGNGFDWVKICEVDTKLEGDCISHSIVLSPCENPAFTNKIAHFFGSDAKNYFIIKKYPDQITTEVHGRNEVPNYHNLSIHDKVRNFFVAHGGIFGFGKVHWKIWTKNILDPKFLD